MALALLSSCSGGKGSGKESGSEALGNDGANPEVTEPEATETEPEEENVKTKRVIVISGQSNAVGHSAQKYLPGRAGPECRTGGEGGPEGRAAKHFCTARKAGRPYIFVRK